MSGRGKQSDWRRAKNKRIEKLEARFLFAGDVDLATTFDDGRPLSDSLGQSNATQDHVWFSRRTQLPRVPLDELRTDEPALQMPWGPQPLVAGEWIVQLSDNALSPVRSLDDIDRMLITEGAHFEVISGLGQAGLVLVRGTVPARRKLRQRLRPTRA